MLQLFARNGRNSQIKFTRRCFICLWFRSINPKLQSKYYVYKLRYVRISFCFSGAWSGGYICQVLCVSIRLVRLLFPMKFSLACLSFFSPPIFLLCRCRQHCRRRASRAVPVQKYRLKQKQTKYMQRNMKSKSNLMQSTEIHTSVRLQYSVCGGSEWEA